tara:strand:+ start:213 stop:371 length:159 start_codon:yes stop_codon:yes gene_type:complete
MGLDGIDEMDQKRLQDEIKAVSHEKPGDTRDKLMFGIKPDKKNEDQKFELIH